ncbi:hypothetical protein [Candidatus Skiveiella danica]|uniref:hypothetical protein n=1 Tax=Candidatus Skiveiella danica TaxID=3386177 RepID=UPI0039B8BC7C
MSVVGPAFITPPYSWPKGLVVNARGERFCNEQVYGATLGEAMNRRRSGRKSPAGARCAAALAVDQECLFGGLWGFQTLPALAMMLFSAKKASSIEALAERISADPAALRSTVVKANAAAAGRAEDPQGNICGHAPRL